MCQKKNIPVIHPYNLGWAGLVAVIQPDGLPLDILASSNEQFNELKMVEYATCYMKYWRDPQLWIDEAIEKYLNEEERLSPPQLPIASWTVAAMCSHLLFKIATGINYKKFPEFYFSTIMD